MSVTWSRRILRAAAAAALATAMAACGGQSNVRNITPGPQSMTTPDAPWTPEVVNAPPVGMGQRSVQRGAGFSLVKVTALEKAGEFSPSSGMTYLSAEVEIDNADRDALPYSFMNFALEDEKGKLYGAVRITPTSAPAPALVQGTLARGAKARGNVLFEVPLELTAGAVVYRLDLEWGGYVAQRSSWRR